MAKRGRKAAEPFSNLDSDFKESVESASDTEIKAKIAEIAMNQAALMEAKKADQDLAEKKAAAKEANAKYKEGTDANRDRLEYCRMILGARGKPAGDSGLDDAVSSAVDGFLDSIPANTKVSVSFQGRTTKLA